MKEFKAFIKKIVLEFNKLSSRERILVSSAAVFIGLYLLLMVFGVFQDFLDNQERIASARKNQLVELNKIAQRYHTLNTKRENLQKKFLESQMTFDQVSIEVDKIINESLGDEKYELTKPNAPTPFGFEFEKQDFKLSIKNINMEQLIKLLYKIEYGGKPLYLSKLDINKNSSASLSAIIEIYSIGKASDKTHSQTETQNL